VVEISIFMTGYNNNKQINYVHDVIKKISLFHVSVGGFRDEGLELDCLNDTLYKQQFV
jgi:hypothetical protein